jgi:hypothetical protein
MSRSSVQNAINDNNYSLIYLEHMKIAENHMLSTVGNTLFKNWKWIICNWFWCSYNSWEFADIALTKGISETVPTGSYNYDEIVLFCKRSIWL